MRNQEILTWLDGHINFEKDIPSRRATMPTLERMKTLCKYIGDPQESVAALHITGTNGKTSTSRITTALLEAKGLSTGLITSPHLSTMNERILINSKLVDDNQLLIALQTIKHAEASFEEIQKDVPSWFEIMVAAGFMCMNEEAVDAGVIEVGMGGLYDATNICNSHVSVITNVALDHMQYLGDTREKIAQEKSGIIKENNFVVIGETDPDIASIFVETSMKNKAKPYIIGEDFEIIENTQAVGGRLLSFRTPYSTYEDVFLPLFGFHQGSNALLAVVAAESFLDAPLGEEVVEQGFANAKSPGRMEIVHRDPLVIIDGAHNIAGAQTFAQALEDEFARTRRIYVLGLTSEKDPDAMINALNVDNDDVVIVSSADSFRAMDVIELAQAVRSAGVEVVIEAPTVKDAIENAMSLALDDDQIVVTGSLYVVGEARELLAN